MLSYLVHRSIYMGPAAVFFANRFSCRLPVAQSAASCVDVLAFTQPSAKNVRDGRKNDEKRMAWILPNDNATAGVTLLNPGRG
ncbi:hypothetical protein [Noviherbaspirillum malthae]|uniref:hypothetical protein n=1 Tax=Noviherbaspirillum malthae TaxID=1260987 RepID=UPI00188E09FA|nr:hypothetical protein [Noviherbaspirillum malthae]